MNHLTVDKYEELLSVFKRIDTEATGFVTEKNLRGALNEVGLEVAGE